MIATTGAAGGGGATVNRTSVRGAQPRALRAAIATTCAPFPRPRTTRGEVQFAQGAPSSEQTWRSTDPRAAHSITTVVAGVTAGGAERTSIDGGTAGTARPRTMTCATVVVAAGAVSASTVSPLRADAAVAGTGSVSRRFGRPSRAIAMRAPSTLAT